DIGYAYCLPKNVKVIMLCDPVTCYYDVIRNKILYSMTFEETTDDEYIRILSEDKTADNTNKYCLFDGNNSNNVIPNLLLTEEKENFSSGITVLPYVPQIITVAARFGTGAKRELKET